jgi:predicted nuclease of predicted toxin-antitoxin system
MSIKLLIDTNLSADWVPIFQSNGWSAIHWSTIGDPCASDRTIMDWASANHHVVFTYDLDFGTILALARATGPSVLQVRAEDVLPDRLQAVVIAALKQHEADLAAGALVVVDASRSRVRVLPI